MLAAFSLASCSSDDDDKDTTKEIAMSVSAEPGVMYDLFDSMGEHPIECIRVMTEDEPGQWQNLHFSGIKGFTYERGHVRRPAIWKMWWLTVILSVLVERTALSHAFPVAFPTIRLRRGVSFNHTARKILCKLLNLSQGYASKDMKTRKTNK